MFDWTIRKLMTREERQPLTRNDTGYAAVTGWKTFRANETGEYKHQGMDNCDLYGIFWKA